MKKKKHPWLTNVSLTKYQSLFCENLRLIIEMCTTLNPVTQLPVQKGEMQQDCLEVLGNMYSSQPDLLDQPIRDPDWELYVDGSSSVSSRGERQAGYAVMTLTETVEASTPRHLCSMGRADSSDLGPRAQ